MTVDIEKLQKLSCLSLNEQQKPALEKSIESVLTMMGEVAALAQTFPTTLPTPPQDTHITHVSSLTPKQLRTQEALDNNLISNQNSNVNLSDGYFLAPKAIKR